MNDMPYFYNQLNIYESSLSPVPIKSQNTFIVQFFKKYLLQKAMSVYEWVLPEYWEKNYFLYTLFAYGFIGILNTAEFGIIPQQCSLQGYNVMYNPTTMLVSNPLFSSTITRKIDYNCVVIKLQLDYSSVMDIINYYGEILGLASQTLSVNMINSQTGLIATAETKAIAESYQKAYDKIGGGNPFVVTDKNILNHDGKLGIEYFLPDVAKNFLGDKILTVMKKLENDFCTMVGIPNNNDEKRERQIVDEVNANNIETQTLASQWLNNLQEGCKKARKMFNIDITVKRSELFNDSDNISSRIV